MTYIIALQPFGVTRSAWLEVKEPETGPVVYVLHEDSYEREIPCSKALALKARFGVSE